MKLIRKIKNLIKRFLCSQRKKKLGMPKSSTLDGFRGISDVRCGEYCAIHMIGSSISGLEIGDYSCLGPGAVVAKLKVGKFSCLGPRLRMAVGEHPTKKIVSIHPAFFSVNKIHNYTFVENQKFVEFKYVDDKFHFVIGNDVWLGSDVLLLEGHKIGDGAIVGAGSVVTKDIPPYEIWGGVPAHFIRKRFNDEQIAELLGIKWWDWSIDEIKRRADSFEDIEAFLSNLEGHPTENEGDANDEKER